MIALATRPEKVLARLLEEKVADFVMTCLRKKKKKRRRKRRRRR